MQNSSMISCIKLQILSCYYKVILVNDSCFPSVSAGIHCTKDPDSPSYTVDLYSFESDPGFYDDDGFIE